MGRRNKKGRIVNGVLLLDKPAGITSNGVLQQIKHLYGARKAGHTGSLDPLATGLLPICFGEATKISAFLLDADKSYQVTVRLGIKTITADAEGDVISEQDVSQISLSQIEKVLPQFIGNLSQIPPMYSAVRHEGKRLYEFARKGEVIERKARNITIYKLSLVNWQNPDLVLDVHCSKGTYIRTLAEDIGEALGCGAHVAALRRTGVGSYSANIDDWVTLEQLESLDADFTALDQLLLPVDSALVEWPAISLSTDSVYYVQMGQAVQVPHAPTRGLVCLYDKQQQFLGVGQVLDDGRINPRRMINTNL